MNLSKFIDIWLFLSAILGFAGTFIIAFSLNGIFNEIRNCVAFIHASIKSIVGHGDIVIFEGLASNIEKAKKKSGIPTFFGLLLILASFACSIVSSFQSAQINASRLNEISSLNNTIKNYHKSVDSISVSILSIQMENKNIVQRLDSLSDLFSSKSSIKNSADPQAPLRR